MTDAYIEINNENITDMAKTYKACLICNLVSSSVFAFFAAGEMIKHGFSYFGSYPLAGFAVIFGCFAVTSYLKYRAIKS